MALRILLVASVLCLGVASLRVKRHFPSQSLQHYFRDKALRQQRQAVPYYSYPQQYYNYSPYNGNSNDYYYRRPTYYYRQPSYYNVPQYNPPAAPQPYNAYQYNRQYPQYPYYRYQQPYQQQQYYQQQYYQQQRSYNSYYSQQRTPYNYYQNYAPQQSGWVQPNYNRYSLESQSNDPFLAKYSAKRSTKRFQF